MADPRPYPDSNLDTGVGSGIPRWVKVFGIIVIVLILLVGAVLLTGVGGQHGPARHTPPTEQGVQQP